MAPSNLVWDYVGGFEDSDEAKLRGEQVAQPGDVVFDDVLGRGIVVGLAGAMLTVEFEGDDGDTVLTERTSGHVRALLRRARKVQPAPVGRNAPGGRGLLQLVAGIKKPSH